MSNLFLREMIRETQFRIRYENFGNPNVVRYLYGAVANGIP